MKFALLAATASARLVLVNLNSQVETVTSTPFVLQELYIEYGAGSTTEASSNDTGSHGDGTLIASQYGGQGRGSGVSGSYSNGNGVGMTAGGESNNFEGNMGMGT